MSFVAAALRRGVAARVGPAAGLAARKVGIRAPSCTSRRCIHTTLVSASGSSEADSRPLHARRPMKTFFADYDRTFDERLAALEVEKREAGLNWDYVAAPFFERPSIIIPDPHPVEEEYWNVKQEIEEKYMEPFEGFLAGEDSYNESLEAALKLVEEQEAAKAAGEATDPEEMRNNIYMKYAGSETGERIIEQYDLLTRQDNPRTTQADAEDNRRSLNRKLDDQLFLILKRKDRTEHAWEFPKGIHADAEPVSRGVQPGLRETGEKAVAQCAGKALKGYYYSHAPQGFFYYKYPSPKDGSIGAKVFFYRVRYLKGAVKPTGKYDDFAWVTRDELAEYLDDDTFAFVRQMVV